MSENLKEELQTAYRAVQKGNVEAAAAAVAALKELPRTESGIFDLTSVDDDIWAAATLAYPVYVAYETGCNKKEGYPDLIQQMRVWDKKLKEEFSFRHVAQASDMWIHTIDWMSPEIYEYYRELLDIFRDNMREALAKYYGVGPASREPKAEEEDALFKAALKLACDKDLMLAEKYEKYC